MIALQETRIFIQTVHLNFITLFKDMFEQTFS